MVAYVPYPIHVYWRDKEARAAIIISERLEVWAGGFIGGREYQVKLSKSQVIRTFKFQSRQEYIDFVHKLLKHGEDVTGIDPTNKPDDEFPNDLDINYGEVPDACEQGYILGMIGEACKVPYKLNSLEYKYFVGGWEEGSADWYDYTENE